MRLSVADARAFAKALNDGADAAEQAGEADVELTQSLQALDDAARADLQAAIAQASSSTR